MFVIRMIGKGELSFNALLSKTPAQGGGVVEFETREAAQERADHFNHVLCYSTSCSVEER